MKAPSLTKSFLLPVLASAFLFSGCASREQGDPTDPTAQVKLGNRYAHGKWVAKDDEEAARWYRKAALQGDAEGQYYLGLCYATGNGVPMNDVAAVYWYRRSALHGNAEAQYRLGRCYELRDGVPKDVVQAYKWLNIAAAAGQPNARTSRDAVAYRMTAEQISRAQQLSRDWKPD